MKYCLTYVIPKAVFFIYKDGVFSSLKEMVLFCIKLNVEKEISSFFLVEGLYDEPYFTYNRILDTKELIPLIKKYSILK